MKYLIFPLCFLIYCCAPTHEIKIDSIKAYDKKIHKWNKYGAFYELDRLDYKAFQRSRNCYDWPATSLSINKKIVILNKDGLKYGSVQVPRLNGDLTRFNIRLTDPDGNNIPVEAKKIKSEYIKSGVIVFPKVTPGCILEMKVKFTFNGYYFSFENWMPRNIPVLNSVFTFTYNTRIYDYDFKEYGNINPPSITYPTSKRKPVRTWVKCEIMPREVKDKHYFAYSDVPIVVTTARKIQATANLKDWRQLSKKFHERSMKTSFFNSTGRIKKIVDGIKKTKKDKYSQADSILNWVQNNISIIKSKSKKINPDKVIKEKQGNLWEISTVLKEMYNHAGIENDIVVSRSKSYGIFDPDFPNYHALDCPMVKVRINSMEYLAYPFSPAFKLGEYSSGFFNLHGLSLSEQKIEPLPAPKHDKFIADCYIKVDHDNDKLEKKIIYREYGSTKTRSILLNRKNQPKDYFEEGLKEIDKDNEIGSFEIMGVKDRGEPLEVKYGYSSPGLVVKRKRKKQFIFNTIMPLYYTQYDTSRVSSFNTWHECRIKHVITVPNTNGKKIKYDFKCKDTSNLLFSTRCGIKKNADNIRFERDLTINKVTLSSDKMKIVYPDILELNNIRKSYVSFE